MLVENHSMIIYGKHTGYISFPLEVNIYSFIVYMDLFSAQLLLQSTRR